MFNLTAETTSLFVNCDRATKGSFSVHCMRPDAFSSRFPQTAVLNRNAINTVSYSTHVTAVQSSGAELRVRTLPAQTAYGACMT